MMKDAIKVGVGLVTSIGAANVANSAMKMIDFSNTNKVVKVCTVVGSYFIAGAVAGVAVGEAWDTIDEIDIVRVKIKNRFFKKDTE